MIINARCGQRSNRIIQIAHGLATAIRCKVAVRITEMDDFRHDYMCEVTWGKSVDIRPSLFWAVERRLHGLAQQVLRRKFAIPGLVSDWSYRDYEGVEKFHDAIVRFFSPRMEVVEYALKFEREWFTEGIVKIGVHLRRGDYKAWHGGRYYFSNDVYLRNMRAIAKELPNKKLFILFSNEPLELSDFAVENSQVVISRGDALDDHYLMSKCDYIFGPPSTFSRWGAYMGRKPLAFIEDRDITLKLADFKYQSI